MLNHILHNAPAEIMQINEFLWTTGFPWFSDLYNTILSKYYNPIHDFGFRLSLPVREWYHFFLGRVDFTFEYIINFEHDTWERHVFNSLFLALLIECISSLLNLHKYIEIFEETEMQAYHRIREAEFKASEDETGLDSEDDEDEDNEMGVLYTWRTLWRWLIVFVPFFPTAFEMDTFDYQEPDSETFKDLDAYSHVSSFPDLTASIFYATSIFAVIGMIIYLLPWFMWPEDESISGPSDLWLQFPSQIPFLPRNSGATLRAHVSIYKGQQIIKLTHVWPQYRHLHTDGARYRQPISNLELRYNRAITHFFWNLSFWTNFILIFLTIPFSWFCIYIISGTDTLFESFVNLLPLHNGRGIISSYYYSDRFEEIFWYDKKKYPGYWKYTLPGWENKKWSYVLPGVYWHEHFRTNMHGSYLWLSSFISGDAIYPFFPFMGMDMEHVFFRHECGSDLFYKEELEQFWWSDEVTEYEEYYFENPEDQDIDWGFYDRI